MKLVQLISFFVLFVISEYGQQDCEVESWKELLIQHKLQDFIADFETESLDEPEDWPDYGVEDFSEEMSCVKRDSKTQKLKWSKLGYGNKWKRLKECIKKRKEKKKEEEILDYKFKHMNALTRGLNYQFLSALGFSENDLKFGFQNIFIPIQVDSQWIWLAKCKYDLPVLIDLVEHILSHASDQSIYYNTGTHGTEEGYTVKEDPTQADENLGQVNKEIMRFYKTKIGKNNLFEGDFNLGYNIVTSSIDPVYPTNANHVINAWCFSLQTWELRKKEKAAAEAKSKGDVEQTPNVQNSIPDALVGFLKDKAEKEVQRTTRKLSGFLNDLFD